MIRKTSCIRIALAVAIVGLGADVAVAAAKAVFAKSADAPVESVSSVKPFILAIDDEAAARLNCHEVVVETDDGYGVRGTVTRTVCRKVL